MYDTIRYYTIEEINVLWYALVLMSMSSVAAKVTEIVYLYYI